ncbi:tetratricopeptide repeat protein [Sphingomonas sp. RP10(2022)]|uniref:Tetratricopeptide repeat protein n=1 Tax=Sphingomonas liriopis TaxID=2949094 RepID=A0A9X2HQM9_9SPHN|nr:tetratricopeptide repeat protein [Sphingomonas liriopis]MCP3735368.1 tetratricopeptide repeat protein [Sphingomonas liriopis]
MASVLSIGAVAPAGADTARLADYLQARAADADGQGDIALAGYARVLAAAPASGAVALPAYREALAAGDVALATRAAAVLRGTPDAPADLPLLPLAIAAERNDAAEAEAAVAALEKTPLAVMVPSLRAWIAFTQGRDPAPAIAAGGKNPVTQRLAAETAALIQIARGDTATGLATVQALRATGSPIDLRLSAAQLLFARGQGAEARALLTGADPVFAALRRGAAAEPTLAYGVSRLFGRVAGDLADQQVTPLSIALARTALIAWPANDRARLLLAEALAGEGATARALATLDAMPADSPFASTATAARISVLVAAKREEEALALARRDAGRSDAGEAEWQRYADRLSAANRNADAAPWYRRVVDADPAAWAAWLQYGGALEQAGDWPAGRAALQKAVALAPREPLALNYLGYAQAQRGVDVTASTAMLERAHALKPADHSITDSLGWAYYVNGDVARALPLLESAAAGDPVNAEIGEHLGDAYWTLGRRYEARYAWRAAALTAPPADAARLVTRIAQGLPRQ